MARFSLAAQLKLQPMVCCDNNLPETAAILMKRSQPITGRLESVLSSWNSERQATELYDAVSELYPICRSITGDGLRETLRALGKFVPLAISEVPTGTAVFDWSVPEEWNIRDAWIKNSKGQKIVDFQE